MVRVRPETKFNSNNFTDIPVPDTGTAPLDLTDIVTQGVGQTSYIGTMVSPKLLQINMTFRLDTAACAVRWYVVQWLVDDSTDAFTVAKYLRDTDVNGFTDYTMRAKFRTLKKGALTLIKPSSTANGDSIKIQTVAIRPRGNVYFTGAGGVAQKNHVFFFAISDRAIVDAPFINLFSRMLYTDS